MEQQPEGANERNGRLPARQPHPTRSFSRSRSRSPSGRDDEDGDDGANGHALSRPAAEGRDSGDEPSPVRETAPACAEEREWARERARKESEDRRLAEPRKAVIVDLSDDLKKLSRPAFAFDRAGSREAIVTHPGHDDGGALDLRHELEYEAQRRDDVYEHLTLGTVWVTPAFLIYLAADSDLLPLMKLMDHITPLTACEPFNLEVHLDITVVASHFAGPETMEVARLMKLVEYGVDRFGMRHWSSSTASMPKKARWPDFPALALLRIHAMALQDVGTPGSRFGSISYKQCGKDPENLEISWPHGGSRCECAVQISRCHLGRMIRLVKDEFLEPGRGFSCFLKYGMGTFDKLDWDGVDLLFTNFLYTFVHNVQQIADNKLADNKLFEFSFQCFENAYSQLASHRTKYEVFGFDEKAYYVHRKHIATLGGLLQECWQLAASRPFSLKFYRPDLDERKLDTVAAASTGYVRFCTISITDHAGQANLCGGLLHLLQKNPNDEFTAFPPFYYFADEFTNWPLYKKLVEEEQ